MAAAPLFFRGVPRLRFRLLESHRISVAACLLTRRPYSTTTSEFTRPDENLVKPEKDSNIVKPEKNSSSVVLTVREPPKYHRWDSPDYRKWKDKEEEILRDINPITLLTKDILHSYRYLDGERLTAEHEKAVINKLLAYHPHSEDKIGCGLDSIMVDRHPQFKNSRCLFVVRTDGGWIDFSYQKCLRAYIRQKYPSYAERFIREHFKRGNG